MSLVRDVFRVVLLLKEPRYNNDMPSPSSFSPTASLIYSVMQLMRETPTSLFSLTPDLT